MQMATKRPRANAVAATLRGEGVLRTAEVASVTVAMTLLLELLYWLTALLATVLAASMHCVASEPVALIVTCLFELCEEHEIWTPDLAYDVASLLARPWANARSPFVMKLAVAV